MRKLVEVDGRPHGREVESHRDFGVPHDEPKFAVISIAEHVVVSNSTPVFVAAPDAQHQIVNLTINVNKGFNRGVGFVSHGAGLYDIGDLFPTVEVAISDLATGIQRIPIFSLTSPVRDAEISIWSFRRIIHAPIVSVDIKMDVSAAR